VQPFNHSAKHHADADCSSFRAKALSSDTVPSPPLAITSAQYRMLL
jgi:hypothetical protein